MAAIPSIFQDEDLNGECFIIGSQGEIEEYDATDVIVFAPDRPAEWEEGKAFTEVAAAHRAAAGDWLHECLLANIQYLHRVLGGLEPIIIAKIAYYRILCIREGYVTFNDDHHLHHCRYSLREQLPDDWRAPAVGSRTAMTLALLTVEDRAQMRKWFLNAVCTVAYIFRTRAHHYATNIESRYKELWNKVAAPVKMDEPLIPWQRFARNAIHAIYPDKLDEIWVKAVADGKCRRPLALRLHAACAGMAGIKALRAGLDDLKGGMPKIAELVQPHEKALVEIEKQIEGKRWAGSVNHNFYGQGGIVFDESKLGAAASFVLNSLEVLSPAAPLSNSPALKRIANQAPITGAIFSSYLMQAVKRPEVLADLMVANISE